MRRAGLVTVLSVIGLAACHNAPEPLVTTIHSGNRLELSMPSTMQVDSGRDRVVVQETGAGFHVFPASGRRRRVSIEAWVELHPGAPAPDGSWPETKRVGERSIRYRIDASEGGSGGTQYDLRAWEPCPGGYLLYRQGDLVEEPGRPNLDLAWMVIAGTRPPR